MNSNPLRNLSHQSQSKISNTNKKEKKVQLPPVFPSHFPIHKMPAFLSSGESIRDKQNKVHPLYAAMKSYADVHFCRFACCPFCAAQPPRWAQLTAAHLPDFVSKREKLFAEETPFLPPDVPGATSSGCVRINGVQVLGWVLMDGELRTVYSLTVMPYLYLQM